MREPATLSRRAAAALPLAALIRPAAAALPTLASGADDAALLNLGRRWQIACAALHANDLGHAAPPDSALADVNLEAIGDRAFADEQQLFDPLMAMRPRTLQGLAMKARALARAFDVLAPDDGALETAVTAAWDIERHSALTLALDILRLAGEASSAPSS